MNFDELERAAASGGLDAVLEAIIAEAREAKKYPQIFEARLMSRRAALGLPLTGQLTIEELPDETRRAFEQAFVDAAREVGGLFLAGGDIARAWPYFRAINDPAPVAAAIEKAKAGENVEAVLTIALEEGVNPRRGFELLLEHFGICRAITFFEQYPDRQTRPAVLTLVVRTLYEELAASLRRVIERVEGAEPASASVRELIAGRDWLFEGASYHVDTSHLAAVLRFALEARDAETIERAREMAEYATRLSDMYHFESPPPFDDMWADHKAYLDALAGVNVDETVARFRAKLGPEREAAAEVLIGLLARLGRYREAIEVARVSPGSDSIFELCERAGDFDLMREIARERGDALGFAASLQGG